MKQTIASIMCYTLIIPIVLARVFDVVDPGYPVHAHAIIVLGLLCFGHLDRIREHLSKQEPRP